MTTTEAALRECPFCGTSEHLSFSWPGSMLNDMPDRPCRVICSHIDHDTVVGPTAYGKYNAMAAWNRRSQPSPPSSTAGEPESDWELEQRAFAYANDLKLSANVRDFIKELWKAYCDASSGEPASVAGEADDAFDLMKAFYLSDFYDPNAARPADNVQAAIAFTLDRIATAAPVAWTGSGSMMALKDGREGYIWPKRADAHPVPLYSALSKPTPVEAGLRLDRDVIAYSIIEGSGGIRAAEHAKDFKTANWTDALRSADAVIVALAALSETQPPRETSTQEKQNG